jgi:hypothetical protein
MPAARMLGWHHDPENEACADTTRRQLTSYARITACQQKRQPSRPLLITLTAARGPS